MSYTRPVAIAATDASGASRMAIIRVLVAAALAPALAACTDPAPAQPQAAATTDTSAPAATAAPPAPVTHPVPVGEPPANVVRDLMFEEYAELEKAGPMPMTVTASGRSLQLRAKLFEARKESCRPVPQRPPGHFECTLTIKLSLTGDGSDPAGEAPSEQGARLGVTWDAERGVWKRG